MDAAWLTAGACIASSSLLLSGGATWNFSSGKTALTAGFAASAACWAALTVAEKYGIALPVVMFVAPARRNFWMKGVTCARIALK